MYEQSTCTLVAKSITGPSNQKGEICLTCWYKVPYLFGSSLPNQNENATEKDIRRRGDDEGWNGRNTRVLVVPGDVSNGGSDGDARLRHVLELVSAVYSPRFLFYCNEHTFVIAENLQCFVQGLDPAMPAYLGNRFRKENNQVCFLLCLVQFFVSGCLRSLRFLRGLLYEGELRLVAGKLYVRQML